MTAVVLLGRGIGHRGKAYFRMLSNVSFGRLATCTNYLPVGKKAFPLALRFSLKSSAYAYRMLSLCLANASLMLSMRRDVPSLCQAMVGVTGRLSDLQVSFVASRPTPTYNKAHRGQHRPTIRRLEPNTVEQSRWHVGGSYMRPKCTVTCLCQSVCASSSQMFPGVPGIFRSASDRGRYATVRRAFPLA